MSGGLLGEQAVDVWVRSTLACAPTMPASLRYGRALLLIGCAWAAGCTMFNTVDDGQRSPDGAVDASAIDGGGNGRAGGSNHEPRPGGMDGSLDVGMRPDGREAGAGTGGDDPIDPDRDSGQADAPTMAGDAGDAAVQCEDDPGSCADAARIDTVVPPFLLRRRPRR